MNTFKFAPFNLILVLSLSFANPVWADARTILNESNLPPEFEATYNIYKGNMHVGVMQASLTKTDEEVIYESSSTPIGMAAFFLGKQAITDVSRLKLIDGRYQVVEFKHNMSEKKKNRNEHYLFDWVNNKASVKYKDRANELDIPDNTFDNYSAQLLLMREPDKQNTTTSYPVISKGRLKEYTYTLEGNEAIETKVGKHTANKFVRRKDNDKKTTYFGWYAEDLNHIPVKLDKYENGKLDVSVQLTKIKWLKQESAH